MRVSNIKTLLGLLFLSACGSPPPMELEISAKVQNLTPGVVPKSVVLQLDWSSRQRDPSNQIMGTVASDGTFTIRLPAGERMKPWLADYGKLGGSSHFPTPNDGAPPGTLPPPGCVGSYSFSDEKIMAYGIYQQLIMDIGFASPLTLQGVAGDQRLYVYYYYTESPFSITGTRTCNGFAREADLSMKPGWNAVVVRLSDKQSRVSTDPVPAEAR